FTELPFAAQFQYLYGVAPSFKRERPSLQLALETLAYPVKPQLSAADYAADATLHLLFWSVNEDLNKRVYMEINRRLGQLDCSVVAVAASLNMSRHTLARRLRAGGSNYAQILERVRRDRALELLSQAQLSIEQVAERLGFAEVGSFSRAFKSWRGQSPRDYRRRALAPLRPATKC
ncbi:MAG: helix-turn-helix transcriptional regulator, partial [Cellvibrionaceae bacterium]|nr:helix-turn-helix transcriptional regulator [Cellvibrionaceae bacterium]